VTLKAFLKTANGRQKALDPIEYDISIPLSPIALVSPESMRQEVTTAMYSVQLQVRPGSTVTVNEVDISDTVSEDGLLIYNATVQPIGDNVFKFRVRAPYCRENALDLTLYREVQEIPLDLAVTTYASTSKSTLEISATTKPGATVDVLTNHSDLDITNLDKTGEFKFVAIFDKIGDNTITITSSYPGSKTSRVDYTIYYVPNQDVYTRKAWPLNNSAEYSELMSNITYRSEHSQVYLVVGTIAEIISTKPQTAIVYTGEDIYNILQLGAEGVQMGTRFVATEECDADPAFKESYVHARKEDIEIIQSPVGMPGRAIHSSFLEKVKAGLKRPKSCPFNCIKTCDVSRSPYCIMLALYNAFRGRLENGYAFCGANAWRTEKIQSVRELIASLRKEYESFSLRDRLFPNKG